MKKGIHPEYKETTITCVCGNVIVTRSTKKDIKTEICSNCHPFMTGKQRVVSSAGRVEKFKKKYEAAAQSAQGKKSSSKTSK
jgi:large subunit ribosomal protein L31